MAVDEEHYDVNYIEAHLSATSFNSAAELVDEYEGLVVQAIEAYDLFRNIPESERLDWVISYFNNSSYIANCNQDYTNCMTLAGAKYALVMSGCLFSAGLGCVPCGVVCVGAAMISLAQDDSTCTKNLNDCIKNQNL